MQVAHRASEADEPLLMENPDRYCMFPIKHQSIWEYYKKAEASFWTGETTLVTLPSLLSVCMSLFHSLCLHL